VLLAKQLQSHRTTNAHILLTNHTPMDFFATLFSITANTPDVEPTPSTPIDAGGGGSPGCIVA